MDRKTLCEALRSVAPRLDADFPGWAVFGGAALVLNGVEGIGVVNLDQKDIVRHKLVTRIVNAYEAFDKESKGE